MVIIMKKLNNNKGAMLVVLIIAITLIAILGASFVSMVGSKQEGFTFLLKGHRANMIVKAGVEWAIRFASDGTDTGGNSIFSTNQTLTFTDKLINPAEPTEGSFSTNYVYNTDISRDILTVTGTYQGISARTELSHFRRYLNPITLSPAQAPSRLSSYIYVPVSGNNDTDANNHTPIPFSQFDITVPVDGYVEEIKFYVGLIEYMLFDYADATIQGYYALNPNFVIAQGLYLYAGTPVTFLTTLGATNRFIPADVPSNTPNTYYSIKYHNAAPAGQYTIRFYSAPVTSTITFTP